MKKNIPVWVFDLDDTLYPRESGLWSQISQRISHYVKNQMALDDKTLREKRQFYYQTYGGALQGMMKESQVDVDDFLSYVHDVDYSPLKKNQALHDILSALKGKKYIFTNADRPHAQRTLDAIGLTNIFDDIYDITAAKLNPKPFVQTYHNFLSKYQLEASNIIMFEDSLKNLEICKQLGMTTILIAEKISPQPSYIDFQAESLLDIFEKEDFKNKYL